MQPTMVPQWSRSCCSYTTCQVWPVMSASSFSYDKAIALLLEYESLMSRAWHASSNRGGRSDITTHDESRHRAGLTKRRHSKPSKDRMAFLAEEKSLKPAVPSPKPADPARMCPFQRRDLRALPREIPRPILLRRNQCEGSLHVYLLSQFPLLDPIVDGGAERRPYGEEEKGVSGV